MIDLATLRKGDKIMLHIGVEAVCTVCYQNGKDSYFVRWAIPGKNYLSDRWCCETGWPRNGRLEVHHDTPFDIVDIIKPPLEELQDRIRELERELAEAKAAAHE